MIPNKTRWKKWTLPSKAGYIGTICSIIGLLIALWPNSGKTDIITIEQNNDNSVNVVRNKSNFNATVVDEDMKNPQPLNDDPRAVRKFRIKGVVCKSLQDGINSLNGVDVSDSFGEIIMFSTSGRIEPVENTQSFFYTGGYLTVLIGSVCELRFENLSIPPMRPSSQLRIESEIQSSINEYVNEDPQIFIGRILQCIESN